MKIDRALVMALVRACSGAQALYDGTSHRPHPADISAAYADLIAADMATTVAVNTWRAFVPQSWRSMSPGVLRDAIAAIASESADCEASTARELAFGLSNLLRHSAHARTPLKLAGTTRIALLKQSGQRCALCGRLFHRDEIDAFLGNSPHSAPCNRMAYDAFKPIYNFQAGWCIDVDHRIPISAHGTDTLTNYQALCHYCNVKKRDRMSVFDTFESIGIGDLDRGWEYQTLRLYATHGCYRCSRTSDQVELTIMPRSHSVAPTLQNMIVTCYEHDLASDLRWRSVSPKAHEVDGGTFRQSRSEF
jgi:hypothetical protein